MTRSCSYEVRVDLVEVRDSAGHRYFLGRGSEVPDWVDNFQVTELLAAGALYRFGVI